MEKSIRNLSGFNNRSYYEINREERNLCAILYHTLLLKGNIEKFVSMVDPEKKHQINFDDIEIYYEYAYPRDLWNGIKKDDANKKRKIILDLLDLSIEDRKKLEDLKIGAFNKYFGGKSENYIESPSNWSIPKFSEELKNREKEYFLKVCKLKWSFNAKPDLVIHIDQKTAICIEAKLESGEGHYPSSKKDIEVFEKRIKVFNFKERNEEYVYQLDIQKYIMENLLGFKDTKYVLITKKSNKESEKEKGCKELSWNAVFSELDTTECPSFIKKWIEKYRQ
jgi:hypothetical protein